MDEHEPAYVPPFVRRLMKDASEEEILQASANLGRYVRALYKTFLQMEEETSESVGSTSPRDEG